jgi:hypothetical protein
LCGEMRECNAEITIQAKTKGGASIGPVTLSACDACVSRSIDEIIEAMGAA